MKDNFPRNLYDDILKGHEEETNDIMSYEEFSGKIHTIIYSVTNKYDLVYSNTSLAILEKENQEMCAEIILLRYAHCYTLAKIAEEYKISRTKVSKIIKDFKELCWNDIVSINNTTYGIVSANNIDIVHNDSIFTCNSLDDKVDELYRTIDLLTKKVEELEKVLISHRIFVRRHS